jgi:hypothetical protein
VVDVDDDDDDDDHDDGNVPNRTTKKLFIVSFSGRTDSKTKRINICRAILYFYTAPITKFIFTTVSKVISIVINRVLARAF